MKNIITRLFENSGDIFGKAALFSCALSFFGLFLMNKLVLAWFPVNQKIIKQIIFIDLYVIAIAVIFFIASNELINLNSYRNSTGVRDIGSALSLFFNESKSMVKMGFAVVMWISGLVISIGFGLGVGFGLTHWIIRGLN